MAGAQDERSAASPSRTGASGSSPQANGTAGSGGGPVLMDLDFVRHLIDAVDGSGIDTLEITRAGTRIRISKSPVNSGSQVAVAPPATAAPVFSAPAPAANPAPASAASAPVEEASAEAPKTTGPELTDVKSPMVGTFYRAPAPEAPAYVEVGSTVSKGQTLCILEAMKLMNELESEVDGVVRQILVENADPVEYGQVLFRIEPTGSS
jgi:acetyl-CoA carboxylase biotin carboxyl carrier protein